MITALSESALVDQTVAVLMPVSTDLQKLLRPAVTRNSQKPAGFCLPGVELQDKQNQICNIKKKTPCDALLDLPCIRYISLITASPSCPLNLL